MQISASVSTALIWNYPLSITSISKQLNSGTSKHSNLLSQQQLVWGYSANLCLSLYIVQTCSAGQNHIKQIEQQIKLYSLTSIVIQGLLEFSRPSFHFLSLLSCTQNSRIAAFFPDVLRWSWFTSIKSSENQQVVTMPSTFLQCLLHLVLSGYIHNVLHRDHPQRWQYLFRKWKPWAFKSVNPSSVPQCQNFRAIFFWTHAPCFFFHYCACTSIPMYVFLSLGFPWEDRRQVFEQILLKYTVVNKTHGKSSGRQLINRSACALR